MNELHQAMGCAPPPVAAKAHHNCRTTFADGVNIFHKADVDSLKAMSVDEQICTVLMRSGAKSIPEICHELGLLENHIYKRLRKLIDNDVVVAFRDGAKCIKYTAVASPPDVTRESVFAIIQTNHGIMAGEIKKTLKKTTIQRPIAELIATGRIRRRKVHGQFRYWPCETQ